jgi:N-acetylated-alpha-linked acidic dipeptidase
MNMGYGGEGGGGIYHSIYDNTKWYTSWSDTSFEYGRALVQTAGTVVLRMSEAEILPFDTRTLVATISRYADDVKNVLKRMRDDIEEMNRQIDEGVFFATADPRVLSVPPTREALPPYLNFAPLENAVDALSSSANLFHADLEKAIDRGSLNESEKEAINDLMRRVEQLMTDQDGLPRRPWFRHLIYAPGFYTGYGVKTLPGIREGIEEKKWEEAEGEIMRVSRVLQQLARHLESARMQYVQ